jgi:nicotinate-nucleotide adenylyltransferase
MWRAGPAPRAPAAGRPRALRMGFHLTPGMRVGLYGGSFNPAHDGHAHVAGTALRRLGLDRVVWLVSPQNPLKSSEATTSLDLRIDDARRHAPGRAMIVSGVEERLGSRYTIDTVRALKTRFPSVRFVWIMGADNLANFHRWRGWTQIVREIPVAIVSRPGDAMKSRLSPAARRFARGRLQESAALRLADHPPPAWIYLTAPLNHASSTALRIKAQKAPAATLKPALGLDTPDA